MFKFIKKLITKWQLSRPDWIATGRTKIQKIKVYPSGIAVWASFEEFLDLNSASKNTMWLREDRGSLIRQTMLKPDEWEPEDPYNYGIRNYMNDLGL